MGNIFCPPSAEEDEVPREPAVYDSETQRLKPSSGRRLILNDEAVTRERVLRACEEGDVSALDEMLTDGIPVTTLTQSDGMSTAHLACEFGHLHIIEFLHGAGDTFESRDENNYTPFFLACECGSLGCAEFLFKNANSPRDLNAKDSHGRTVLIASIMSEQLKVVEFLLDSGASVEALSDDGQSPFWVACATQQREIVQTLVARGAVPNFYSPRNGAADRIDARSQWEADDEAFAEYLQQLESGV